MLDTPPPSIWNNVPLLAVMSTFLIALSGTLASFLTSRFTSTRSKPAETQSALNTGFEALLRGYKDQVELLTLSVERLSKKLQDYEKTIDALTVQVHQQSEHIADLTDALASERSARQATL